MVRKAGEGRMEGGRDGEGGRKRRGGVGRFSSIILLHGQGVWGVFHPLWRRNPAIFGCDFFWAKRDFSWSAR